MPRSLSIYIVEDEPLIVSTIETALLKQGFKVLGDADEVNMALKDIDTLKPDLTLIDIQLDGSKDGVDLAMELDKREMAYLYLTSQTDPETVNRVKDTNPLGYIVKPFTEAGLRSNIELAWHNHTSIEDQYLTFRSEGRLHKINQNSVLYLQAFDNYCYVVTRTNRYLVPKTLKHTAQELNGQFIKTHRSYWVNLKRIESVGKDNILINNVKLPLSSGQKALVLNKLKSN